MKLRNKKTGEVEEFDQIYLTKMVKEKTGLTGTVSSEYIKRAYSSHAEFDEEWEDYNPKQPLIKDEKIRKAVRAWAEANGLKKIYFQYHNDLLYMSFCDPDTDYMSSIFFDGDKFDVKEYSESLQGNTLYPIKELCGELQNDAEMQL